MMHARPIHPHKTKQLPNSFGLTGLAPVAWHKLRLSLYITSRMLFVLSLSQSGLAYLQEIDNIYINIHVWTLRASTHERPPCVLRHMGNAYAVAHIFTHTLPFTIETAAIQFSAVWPTLTYATQWRIHKFLYSQYNRPRSVYW